MSEKPLLLRDLSFAGDSPAFKPGRNPGIWDIPRLAGNPRVQEHRPPPPPSTIRKNPQVQEDTPTTSQEGPRHLEGAHHPAGIAQVCDLDPQTSCIAGVQWVHQPWQLPPLC